jgi:exosortase
MIDKLRAWIRPLTLKQLAGFAILGTCLLWSYWPTFEAISHEWATNPVYSHGFLVPVFALALLGFRRQKLEGHSLQPDWLGGGTLLLIGAILRLAGAYYYVPWLEMASLLPCLAGLCLLLAGRPYLAWSWPAIAFLFFMMPLPYRLETGMRQPLQRLATQGSTYILQTVGCPAFAEGNVIVLKDKPLEVSEACSGLSMLMVFFALATAVALIIRRPLWEKGLVLLSAVPIAVIANVGRISLTGLLQTIGRPREADLIFHDLAGWLMMPAGLAMIGIELKIFGRLMVTPAARQPLPITFARQGFPAIQSDRSRAAKPRHRQRG